jgi:pyruvate formate lyase activating enzyme
MKTGIIFDIKEFAVHDGPGIRTTVFLKGCPLRCQWCHNPEGLSREPQIMKGVAADRMCGQEFSAEQLAELLKSQADILRSAEGGVTFSGGEPLMQAEFVADVIDRLEKLHVLLDTSGFGSEDAFRMVASRCHLLFFDIKLIDEAEHRRWTGVSNDPILRNLAILCELDVPFIIRVPLIPGVTDTDANLAGIARMLQDLSASTSVDLLPYNKTAGGKYRVCGMTFEPEYDENRRINANMKIFRDFGLPARVTTSFDGVCDESTFT